MTATTGLDDAITTDRPGIPFGRLAKVELRKMVDTRANRWLLIITFALMLLVLGILALVFALDDGVRITANDLSQIMVIPVSLLIPLFAILTITGEWGQRTHLTTFAAEPRRVRVIGAKLVAVLLIAVSTIVIAIVAGALANLMYGAMTGREVVWNLDGSDFAWQIVLQLLYFLMAFGLAGVLLSTPAAVALFYVFGLLLPFMVYAPLTFAFDWARDLIPWIDFNYAAAPVAFGTDFNGELVEAGVFEWIRFLFASALWVVVPNAIGAARMLRSEVK